MQTLFVLYFTFSLVLIGISIPLIGNKVRPNGLYGFRVKATMDDPRLWYPVNHYFALRLLATGIALLIASVVLYQIPGVDVDAYAIAVLIVFCLFFIPSLLASFRYLHRIKGG